MRMKQIKKSLSLIFCMMLIVAMALFICGCNDKAPVVQKAENSDMTEETVQETETSDMTEETVQETETSSKEEESTQEIDAAEQTEEAFSEEPEDTKGEVTVLGEGKMQFLFTVIDKDGAETVFEIHTDKETVGDALLELELIAGEEGEFGIYVKTVNGIAADFDEDGTYWAFYVNGEYAMSGVDTTAIEANTAYIFKVEK